jgi:nucleoside-diphosphate-sugar epimerase
MRASRYLRWEFSSQFNQSAHRPSSQSSLIPLLSKSSSNLNTKPLILSFLIQPSTNHHVRSHPGKFDPDSPHLNIISRDLSLQITGVSGYIGFKTMILTLEAGHKVRAVVRRSEQIAKLQAHPRVQSNLSQLSFVVIPVLADADALVANLEGVTGILHLASPLAIETEDYDKDIVQPALAVTNSVLSAAKRTLSIKRVVITSSAVTLIPFEWLSNPDISKTYTEKDLNSNPTTPYHSSMEAYWASKALSRMAAHTFLTTHPKSHFEIIQLLPSVVIGPDALATTASSVLSGTRALALGPILGQILPSPLVGVPVHVDDVARAHVDALKETIEGNKDYVLTSDTPEGIEWNGGLAIAKKYFPEAVGKGILKLGGGMPTQKWKIDTSATEKAFGWKCQNFETTMKDLVGQYVSIRGR